MKTAFVVVAEEQPMWQAMVWPSRGQLTRMPDSLGRIQLTHYADSPEEAAAIHAQIPKSYNVKLQGDTLRHDTKLHPDDRNGGLNESGLTRYRKLRNKLEEIGHGVQFQPTKFDVSAPNWPDEDEFEQALKNLGY